MTRIKDPKQVASTIRQILFILITSSSAGFMALSWLRGPGCPGGAPEAQEPGPCRAERSPGGAGQGWAGLGWGDDREGFAAALGAPSPGQGYGRRRSCSGSAEMRGPPAARSCASCCSSPPPRRRLRSRRRPPRCLLAGRAARVRALMVPPPRWPLWLSDGPPPSSPKA